MTWYADQVMATASPGAIRAFRADPVLRPFAYHLTNPLDHAWHSAEVIHRLPEHGLLVLRPVCDATPGESPADWYGEPVLDWHSFVHRADAVPMIDRIRVAESCSLAPEAVPPNSFLSHLKRLALETRSTFAFYSCSMWGGDVECEYAWVFGDSERALIGLQPEMPGAARLLAILEPLEPTRVVTGDVLVSTLGHLSLDLPTPYFAPHTRSFPWAKSKLGDKPA